MDNSRDSDLKLLHARMHNRELDVSRRNQAYRSFNSILAQIKDRKLVELRRRMIRARSAGDDLAAEKIELLIDEHVKQTHY